jgi:hypothetical protein
VILLILQNTMERLFFLQGHTGQEIRHWLKSRANLYTGIYVKIKKAGVSYHGRTECCHIIALEGHNNAPLRGRNYSDRQQFDEVERNTLMPLPALR